MLGYIARRLLLLPVVLFGVSVLIFALLSALNPYERLSFYVDENILTRIDDSTDWDILVERFGLNRPIHEQYITWIGNVFRGQLGYSIIARLPVRDAILKNLPATHPAIPASA